MNKLMEVLFDETQVYNNSLEERGRVIDVDGVYLVIYQTIEEDKLSNEEIKAFLSDKLAFKYLRDRGFDDAYASDKDELEEAYKNRYDAVC